METTNYTLYCGLIPYTLHHYKHRRKWSQVIYNIFTTYIGMTQAARRRRRRVAGFPVLMSLTCSENRLHPNMELSSNVVYRQNLRCSTFVSFLRKKIKQLCSKKLISAVNRCIHYYHTVFLWHFETTSTQLFIPNTLKSF